MKSNKLYIILSPLLTGLTLLVVYKIYGLYPFGNNTLAWCDMTQQALPLMMQAGVYTSGNISGLFSIVTAGGMNIIGVSFSF